MRCPNVYRGLWNAVGGMRSSYAPGVWVRAWRIIFLAPTWHRLPKGLFMSFCNDPHDGWVLEIFDDRWMEEDVRNEGIFRVASSDEFLAAKAATEIWCKREIELSVETAKAVLWYAEQKKADDEQDAKDKEDGRIREEKWRMSEEERIAEKIRNDAKEIGSLMQKIRGMQS